MSFLALLNHVINFVAPAVWLALLMPLLSRIFMKKIPVVHALPKQVAIHFAVLVPVLVIGLLVFGRDGKMLTYLSMVLCCATVQWAMFKAWR
jgi:tetraacyldisaccharide-1-P 4'-kinase